MAVAPSPSGYHASRFFAWPASQLGRRAVLVTIGALAWVGVLIGLALLDIPDQGWVVQLSIGISALAVAVVAAASGVAAVVAITRGERSLALALPLLVGAFWTTLIIGELLIPH